MPLRGERQVGLQQALELDQRLVVEADVAEIAESDPAFAQAVAHRVDRESRIVLLPGEALLLGRRDDLAVAHEACRAVMVEGGDAEDIRRHGRLAGRRRLREQPPDAVAQARGDRRIARGREVIAAVGGKALRGGQRAQARSHVRIRDAAAVEHRLCDAPPAAILGEGAEVPVRREVHHDGQRALGARLSHEGAHDLAVQLEHRRPRPAGSRPRDHDTSRRRSDGGRSDRADAGSTPPRDSPGRIRRMAAPGSTG